MVNYHLLKEKDWDGATEKKMMEKKIELFFREFFRILSFYDIDCMYREQWWLILGSSGGSLVATPDCKTAVLGSNPAISPAYSGLLS
jgi:hypothetical protein